VQTIKTAVVVVLLLFVLYGGYVAFNGSDTTLKPELEELLTPGDLDADVSGPGPLSVPKPAPGPSGNASDAFAKFASSPLPSFNNASSPPPNAAEPSIPDLDIPQLDLPKPPAPNASSSLPNNTPVSLPGANPSAPNKDPGFGLAVPDARPKDESVSAADALAETVAPPALDLPSIHGDARTLEQVTKTKLNEETVRNAPNVLPLSKSGRSFENAKQLAIQQASKGSLRDALGILSVFYNAPELTTDQRADLLDLLDALAAEVIFSKRHLMEFQYVTTSGETLEQVAKRYSVPRDVLARINGFDGSDEPRPGTQLKVVQGPFRAEVDLTRSEITLFLGELYAGRFPVAFGADPVPHPGTYEVADKQRNKNYYSTNGMQIPADDPKNPYGGFWIDLGQDVCIHGSASLDQGSSNLGCIGLSPLDASDVFGMLGRGSQVTIRR
jgi:LysM repeat protein